MRLLHSGTGHPLSAASKLATRYVELELKGAAYICSSTQDFLDKMSVVVCEGTDKLARIDIDDFYMAGTHKKLAEHAFHDEQNIIDEPTDPCVRTLDCQFDLMYGALMASSLYGAAAAQIQKNTTVAPPPLQNIFYFADIDNKEWTLGITQTFVATVGGK